MPEYPIAQADSVVWSNGLVELRKGDARYLPLPDQSVHCVVTSPPYWSLRDYGLATWEGGDPHCDHIRHARDHQQQRDWPDRLDTTASYGGDAPEHWPNGVCGHCGAHQQSAGIGLEPSLEEWLANIVAVLREVRRVLRDDGSVWLNLGDAYAGSGKGMNADGTHSDGEKQKTNRGTLNIPVVRGKRVARGEGSGRWGGGNMPVEGLAAKNLVFQPHRVALALQQPWLTCRECEATHHQSRYGRWPDGRLICPECLGSHGVAVETPGWIARQTNHWIKPNPMPESVNDRTTSGVEYVFHLTKQARYFYDAEAVRQPYANSTIERFGKNPNTSSKNKVGEPGMVRANEGFTSAMSNGLIGSANLRNWWVIPTQGRKDTHYASFPDRLPELCILAGTSERGVCAQCGNPWVRVAEKTGHVNQREPAHVPGNCPTKTDSTGWKPTMVSTDQWRPTCECGADTVPATVLDCFVGRGTTSIVAQRLGRRSVGLDLNPDYLALARRNLEATNLPMPLVYEDTEDR